MHPQPSGFGPELDVSETKKRRRELFAIAFVAALFIGLTIAELKLTTVSSTLPFVNSIFFFGLLNINIILLIALVWLVFRNIGKLFFERRSKILGARLKTKLVLAFLGFSIIPTLILFAISSLYINQSFDKWFSLKIQNTLQSSLEITRNYYRNADRIATHFAEHLSRQIGPRSGGLVKMDRGLPLEEVPPWILEYLRNQRELLALNAVEFYFDPADERIIVQDNSTEDLPTIYPRIPLDMLEKAFSGEKFCKGQTLGSGDLIRCLVPVMARKQESDRRVQVGIIVVNSYIPVSLKSKVWEIASVVDDYKETNPLKYPIKTTYFVILVMITLVIIFVEIWMGLYMARELTVPVERLVHGAEQVGSGNLEVAIEGSGQDEISVLINSFNKMTHDLRDNRERLTQASTDLEKRRMQLEAVLANIGAGVLVVDNEHRISTFNRAASQLLGIEAKEALWKTFSVALTGDASALTEVIERAFKVELKNIAGEISPEVSQWNLRTSSGMRSLAAVATPLREGGTIWGVVVVVDDMTHLIKAQREFAWREVARRIAHEIKNPLTPIKLSAQRLQRRLGSLRGKDGALLQECTNTIIKHTDELKEMVNEFSSFARFPEASPAPHNLNEAIQEVVTLFSQAHPGITFELQKEDRMPVFEFDRDQIKRVILNLLDNAVAALEKNSQGISRFIRCATHFNDQLQIAVISLEDNGLGMNEEVRSRVFEPYFSTKKDGTGLGLAIVKRIVNDHDGFIRVHSSEGKGTQFLIELPTTAKSGMSA